MPEIIDPVFAKTSQNARFLLSENERFGLVFVKTGSINSGTDLHRVETNADPNTAAASSFFKSFLFLWDCLINKKKLGYKFTFVLVILCVFHVKIRFLKGHDNEADFPGFCRNWFLIDPLHCLTSCSDFGFVFADSASRFFY